MLQWPNHAVGPCRCAGGRRRPERSGLPHTERSRQGVGGWGCCKSNKSSSSPQVRRAPTRCRRCMPTRRDRHPTPCRLAASLALWARPAPRRCPGALPRSLSGVAPPNLARRGHTQRAGGVLPADSPTTCLRCAPRQVLEECSVAIVPSGVSVWRGRGAGGLLSGCFGFCLRQPTVCCCAALLCGTPVWRWGPAQGWWGDNCPLLLSSCPQRSVGGRSGALSEAQL